MKIFSHVLGAVVVILFAATTIIMAFVCIIVPGLAKLIPIKSLRHKGMHLAYQTPMLWIGTLNLIMRLNSYGKWDVEGPSDQLKRNGCYLLISNHVSWIDILILNAYFNRKVPTIKFFMKKQLRWTLPVVGLACWLLDYPFMERHTREQVRKNPALKGRDIKTTRQACQRLKAFPTTLVNFVEGTRFTERKHQKQQSPFRYLLKPKAGGFAIAIEELHDTLDGIIDATIVFPDGRLSLWDFARGNFSRLILRYRILPVNPKMIGDYFNDREFRPQFQNELNTIWKEKDNLIDTLKQNHE